MSFQISHRKDVNLQRINKIIRVLYKNHIYLDGIFSFMENTSGKFQPICFCRKRCQDFPLPLFGNDFVTQI